jgi:hypothetical protein
VVASALELIGDGNDNGVRFFRLGEHHREERVNWRGERGWPGLHSERARDVESLGRACSPCGGLSLRVVGHRTPGRSLNSTAPASTEPTDGQGSTDHSS